MTFPSRMVLNLCQAVTAIASSMNFTEPSHMTTLTPPEWRLRELNVATLWLSSHVGMAAGKSAVLEQLEAVEHQSLPELGVRDAMA